MYDPLADAPPPRYSVESDDEDECNTSSGLSAASKRPPEVKAELRAIYDLPRGGPVIFASGEAGASWAKMVNLGERRAGVYVNDLPVGLVFCPSWTSSVIVVSEAEDRRLPLFTQAAYATTIIQRLQPTNVAILDSYPTKAYISPRVISQDAAPIRYLSFGKKLDLDPTAEMFAPPNLIQSTTASLLNALFLRSLCEASASSDAISAILLPSPRIPRPPPITFNSGGAIGDFADMDWERETLEKAHSCLLSIVGEEVDESGLRARSDSLTRSTVATGITRSTLGEVGEGGMYI